MRKVGISQAEVDATKIIEDTDDFLVVPAIIAREGVFPYPEGRAFKPAPELKEAVWTADGAWIVGEKHPDTLIVTNTTDIIGRIEKPFFCEKINGINAQLRFDKKRAKPEFLAEIKIGKRKDVSLGFFYDFDATPGEFQGQRYDFVQRKILIDHVAAGVPVGRCSSPYCGIAVDELIRKRAADPWEETEDYIRSGHRDASETCRTDTLSEEQGIKAVICRYGDEWKYQSFLFAKAKGWDMDKAKAWFESHREAADVAADAVWDTEYINNLPDSCFAYVEDGDKDDQGKTIPRSKRHLPYKNAEGQIDHDHLVNALARVKQTATMPEGGKSAAIEKLCSAVRAWNREHADSKIESDVCGTESSADALCEIERTKRLLSQS